MNDNMKDPNVLTDAPPIHNPKGSTCGLCDGTDEHDHPQLKCVKCGAEGLAENMPLHNCKLAKPRRAHRATRPKRKARARRYPSGITRTRTVWGRRKVELDGRRYVIEMGADGVRVTEKGKRQHAVLQWHTLIKLSRRQQELFDSVIPSFTEVLRRDVNGRLDFMAPALIGIAAHAAGPGTEPAPEKACGLCGATPATIHLTQIENGKPVKTDWCKKCAIDHGGDVAKMIAQAKPETFSGDGVQGGERPTGREFIGWYASLPICMTQISTPSVAGAQPTITEHQPPSLLPGEYGCISLHEPWVACIFHHGKRIENQTWALPAKYLNTPVLIQAAKHRETVIPPRPL